MFIQTIQGHVTDPAEMREALDGWMRDLAPGAEGWLGSTAGVTANGEFVALIRFESADLAQRNSHRPEQHQWWMETSKSFAGGATFYDSVQADAFLDGGSDEAGFVQVIQGRTSDPERLGELTRAMETIRDYRPEIIGGTSSLHEDGTFTQAVYFTSEEAAREGERKTPPEEFNQLIEEEQALMSELRYFDLTEPWLYSPGR